MKKWSCWLRTEVEAAGNDSVVDFCTSRDKSHHSIPKYMKSSILLPTKKPVYVCDAAAAS